VQCYQGWSRLNNSGQPAPTCQVTVWNKGTNVLSNIYLSNSTAPSAVAPNPFTAGSDGSVLFYAPNGRYTVQFSASLSAIPTITTPYSLADLMLYDPGTIGS
jgi:phage baseplate assembly protein gpV